MRPFSYLGPEELMPAERVAAGSRISSRVELMRFIQENGEDLTEPFTFVIDEGGALVLAPRRTEHVRAAGGIPVLGAGEIAFDESGEVTHVSNLSAGYRPDESSWAAVEEALQQIDIRSPGGFHAFHIFRTCPKCGQLNIVKDDWFECAECGSPLPH